MPLGRSLPRTGPGVPGAQPADAPCHAPLQLWHEPTQRFSSASQLLIVQRCDNRLNPPGRAVALRLRARQRSSRGDRARLRQDVAYRVITAQPGSRSRDDRAFRLRHERRWPSCSARAWAVRAGGPGHGWGGGDRRHEDRRQRQSARPTSTSSRIAREILARRPRRPTRPRTSCSARRAATSCPSSCAPARAGARRCARLKNASRANANIRLRRRVTASSR